MVTTKIGVAFSICMMMFLTSNLFGQKQPNFGLTRKQPAAILPKGNAPFQTAVEKPRSGKAGVASPIGNSKYNLTTGWELTDDMTGILNGGSVFNEAVSTKGWYDAVVPGTVLTSLVAAGKYPDPYFGLNNMAITDSLCRKDWWYRTTFETPTGEDGKMAWLTFGGINYKARVWLNGHHLGDIRGAFVRGTFKVSDYLKPSGRNVLLVQMLPPHNPGIPDEQSALSGMGKNGGILTMDGPTFFATEGWDWIPGIRDRDMGIWQDVSLSFTGTITATDPQIITDLPLPDTSSARVVLRTELVNHATTAQQATIQFSFEGVSVSKQVALAAGEVKPVTLSPEEYLQLKMMNPRLWWPNGYGLPQLYRAVVKVSDAKGLEQKQDIRFGIREYEYEMMADMPAQKAMRFVYSPTDMKTDKPLFDFSNRREFENRIFIPSLYEGVPVNQFQPMPEKDNPFLVIRVNGKRIFCKGGNWGMDDAMKQISRERLEPAFRLHREANFNLIRNWTGVSFEPVFFELADEYGMMVWNDFWISTEGFNLNPADQEMFLENSLDVIKRYRNHASIAIWCPRNEGYAPQGLADELATQVAKEDGTRHYIGNSREANLRQSGPWHFFENNTDYFTKHGKGFTTEIGTFSVPEASTIRKFMDPADQWPINDVWHYHDLHMNNQNLEGYLKSIDSLYGPSNDLDDFNRKVQLVNYESHRAIFEAWNSNLWNTGSGVLLWMSHPAWPSMIWQTYSWDFQTHGSFYGSKKGCEPLHIQLNLHDNRVVVANTSLSGYEAVQAGMQIFSADGKVLQAKTLSLNISANEKADVFEANIDNVAMPANYLVRLWLKDKKGSVIAANEYWRSNNSTGHFKSFNDLPNVSVTANASRNATGQIIIVVENKSKSPAIGVRFDALDNTDQIVLPAYFSDAYFTLLPREKRTIMLDAGSVPTVDKIQISGYNTKGVVPIQ